MTSTGNPPQGAPSKTLLQIMATRAAVNADGTLATWFLQFLERLVNYVGSPSSGGTTTGGGSSVSDLVTELMDAAVTGLGMQGADAATQAVILELQNAVPPLPSFVVKGDGFIPPLPPMGGVTVASEGVGSAVYDAATSTASQAFLRSIQGGYGISVNYSADGQSIIIGQITYLSSGGTLLSSGGTQLVY